MLSTEQLVKVVGDVLEQWDQCDDALALTDDFLDAMNNLRVAYDAVVNG